MMRLRNASALRSAGAVDPADAAQASGIGARKWRPAWEAAPAAAALAASAGTALFGAVGWMPIDAALACGGALALLAGWRTAGALSVWRRRAPLSGFAPLFMTMEDLAARMRAMGDGRLPQAARTGADPAERIAMLPGGGGGDRNGEPLFRAASESPVGSVWFGLGFPWTPVEAQAVEELSRIDWRRLRTPPRLRRLLTPDPGLTDRDIGLGFIHGAGPGDALIERPISSLGGGTLIVGTTQAGKGVMLSNLVSQAILRGDAVIVIDPKSSKRLLGAVRAACRAAGREAPLEFHPAFPKRGVRLDPLGSRTRATEIASRVTAVMPEGDGAFTAFAWEAVHVMTLGLLHAGERPTLRAFRRLLDTGVEELLGRCLERDLAEQVPRWRERLRRLALLEGFERAGRRSETALETSLSAAAEAAVELGLAPAEASRILASLEAGEADPGGREPAALRVLVALWEEAVLRAPGGRPSEASCALLSVWRHSPEHYAKITASLKPVLAMLTSGPLGRSLSPDDKAGEDDEDDEDDEEGGDNRHDDRPVVTMAGVIAARRVLYLGLDALPDATVAGALGSILLSDLAAAAGDIYSRGASGADATRVALFVDETANVVNGPLIEILNKGLEAGISTTCAMQTVSDLEARLGGAARARMVLGNLNNLVALRTKDQETQRFVAESFGRTTLWETSASLSTRAQADPLPGFSASASRSLTGRRDAIVPLECLGSLPNLEFFASLSGGRLWKGRIPILLPEARGRRILNERGELLSARERARAGARPKGRRASAVKEMIRRGIER